MINNIIVRGNRLEFNSKVYACAIGKNGFAKDKVEGDNCTPIGNFLLRGVLYRADKVSAPQTRLPTAVIAENDGWCDAPDDKNYNRKVKLPYEGNHEKLWRDDNLYNLIVPLGYNDNPVVPGKGSAIFMHIAKPEYEGTEGCVALKVEDLLEILKVCDNKTQIILKP